jgi:predicted  nucleic acid-binding Zn-ribbon protein
MLIGQKLLSFHQAKTEYTATEYKINQLESSGDFESIDHEFAIRQQLMDLQFQLEELQQSIPVNVFSLYNSLAERFDCPVVKVRNKSCLGCFMPLSMVNLSAWRTAKGVIQCDHCDRILC